MLLKVHYLPQFVAESELAGSTVVVVDLLRASSTICQALAAGARCVVPSVEVDATWEKAQRLPRSEIVLGGERGGLRIEGFDLGNSPAQYTSDQVFGRTVLFTTTNGTRAIAHARLAMRVLIGAAVNRRALVESLAHTERVDILCAGTGGQVTREDILTAGALVEEIFRRTPAHDLETNSWADAARGEWQELLTAAGALGRTANEQLALELRRTTGGKNLLALGYESDLAWCARLDALDVVPELDAASGEIRLP